MKMLIKRVVRLVRKSFLSAWISIIFLTLAMLEYWIICLLQHLKGEQMPGRDEIDQVEEKVTFVFKSFERQSMAKRLLRNIRKFYPNVQVVIADDSRKPLEIHDPNLIIIQMPFNSGLSRGLNAALAEVKTPYVMRMDEDELLMPSSNIGLQLRLLEENQKIDLVAFQVRNALMPRDPEKSLDPYMKCTLDDAPRDLLIPCLTEIDERHIVLAKPPNIWLARTDKIREVGYDDYIRMIDHNDFFYRAAGRIVSVADRFAFVYHYHNRYDRFYSKYRADVDGDRRYISITRSVTKMLQTQIAERTSDESGCEKF